MAAWLRLHRRGWCRRGARLPVLCVVSARGLEHVQNDVLIVSLDRLLPALQIAAGTSPRPRFSRRRDRTTLIPSLSPGRWPLAALGELVARGRVDRLAPGMRTPGDPKASLSCRAGPGPAEGAPPYRSGESCHGSSSIDQRGGGHRSRAQSKKSEPSWSSTARCSCPTTSHTRSGSCSMTVKRNAGTRALSLSIGFASIDHRARSWAYSNICSHGRQAPNAAVFGLRFRSCQMNQTRRPGGGSGRQGAGAGRVASCRDALAAVVAAVSAEDRDALAIALGEHRMPNGHSAQTRPRIPDGRDRKRPADSAHRVGAGVQRLADAAGNLIGVAPSHARQVIRVGTPPAVVCPFEHDCVPARFHPYHGAAEQTTNLHVGRQRDRATPGERATKR